jgi:hypothetical protein
MTSLIVRPATSTCRTDTADFDPCYPAQTDQKPPPSPIRRVTWESSFEVTVVGCAGVRLAVR